MSGLGEHPHEPQKPAAMDPSGLGKPAALDHGGLETLSDDELEAELTIAATRPVACVGSVTSGCWSSASGAARS